MREKLDLDKGGIGGSAKSGEAEERMETLALRQEELSKVVARRGMRHGLEMEWDVMWNGCAGLS